VAEKIMVDLENKLIIAKPGITALDAEIELYSDLKEDWRSSTNGELAFEFPFDTTGGDPIGAGLNVGAYFFLRNELGWRIRPQEADHELKIAGNLYPKDAAYPMFVPTVGGYTVSIQIEKSSLTQKLIYGSGINQQDKDDLTEQIYDRGVSSFDQIAGNAVAAQQLRDNMDKIVDVVNCMPRIKKGEALEKFAFVMVSSTDHITPKVGLSVLVEVSIEGTGYTQAANSVVEIGGGAYRIDLIADEMDGSVILLRFSAPGADIRFVSLLPS